ncbi:MAG TPA: hypothetical protein VNE61_15660 [Ktedonobacteraceae bacterium]|nr:hypothetical protein [Ktedonobacteraceae bacterium]
MRKKKYEITALTFVDNAGNFTGGNGDFVARMPGQIATEDELLRILGKVLHFPDDYSPEWLNWNLVNDALSDLLWIEQRRIILIHKDLPVAKELDVLGLYLQCLIGAKQNRRLVRLPARHELMFVFPSNSYSTIDYILRRINEWGWVNSYKIL